MKKIWKEYRVEITVMVLVLFGLILLVGPFGIRDLLHGTADVSSSILKNVFQALFDRLMNFLLYFTMWDIVGLLLIIGPIIFLLYRIRHRYLTSPDTTSRICPRCGGSIERIHRSWFDRLLGNTLLPKARRYRCIDRNCAWSGLRH
jgi:hypothetical protein